MILRELVKRIKKFYCLKILKRKYYRLGQCLKCGGCCKNIYVRHGSKIIKTEEEFENIKNKDGYSFYKHISIIGKDEFGLIFACDKFDEEKKLCKDHKNRPSICRNYPSEEMFTFGASLQEGCGFKFVPIVPFCEVLEKIQKRKRK